MRMSVSTACLSNSLHFLDKHAPRFQLTLSSAPSLQLSLGRMQVQEVEILRIP
jgi:hypothetical protein